jgi:predicted O-methyltransferase YrrM
MTSLKNWFGRQRRVVKCAVVTPVGPGHAKRARDCRASIEAAWRQSRGPFSQLEFHFVDDSLGALGRSRARNIGTEAARQSGADWIFFLDADDLMAPRAFSIFEKYAEDYDAVWGLMAIKPPGESAHHIRFPQALTLHSLDELLLLDPFLTLLMGHFVRTSAAVALPFDETMDAGEDFDYYVRAWEHYRCAKIAEVLSVNRSDQHSSGPRAASADQWRCAATARLTQGMTKRGLERHTNRAISAVNRCSEEAQAFSRARDEADPRNLKLLASRLPYRGFVDVTGCAGGEFILFSNNDDPVSLSIGWTGEYLPASTRLWQALAKDAASILDVGASCGYFTLLAARAAPAASILSFEPLTAKFARLELNLALNEVRNVRAMSAAIGGIDAQMALSLLANPTAPALVRIGAEADAAEVVAFIARRFDRASPDFLLAAGQAQFGKQPEQELRARGYRIYEIDEEDEAIMESEKFARAAGTSGGMWATTRRAEDVERIVAGAYCALGLAASR